MRLLAIAMLVWTVSTQGGGPQLFNPTTSAPVDIKGRVVFRAGSIPAGLEVGLEPLPNRPFTQLEDTNLIFVINEQPMPKRPAPAPVDSSGVFTIRGVIGGRYDLTLAANSEQYYVSETRVAGKTIEARPELREQTIENSGRMTALYAAILEIGAAPPDLELVLGLKGNVAVTVQDENKKPVKSAVVGLIPNAPFRGKPAYYKTGIADGSGKVAFRNVMPGEYTVFAAEGVRLEDMLGDAILMANSTFGRPATVAEGGSVDVTAPVIPKAASPEEKR